MNKKLTKKTICIINPNTSLAMTKQIRITANNLETESFKIKTTCSEFGPESIEDITMRHSVYLELLMK